MKREKRLKKGIESLEIQKGLHGEKLKNAEEKGNIELADYYAKEIRAIEERIEDRKKKLERK